MGQISSSSDNPVIELPKAMATSLSTFYYPTINSSLHASFFYDTRKLHLLGSERSLSPRTNTGQTLRPDGPSRPRFGSVDASNARKMKPLPIPPKKTEPKVPKSPRGHRTSLSDSELGPTPVIRVRRSTGSEDDLASQIRTLLSEILSVRCPFSLGNLSLISSRQPRTARTPPSSCSIRLVRHRNLTTATT